MNEIAEKIRKLLTGLEDLQENEDVYENAVALQGVEKCVSILNKVKLEFGGKEDDLLFYAEDDDDEEDDECIEEDDESIFR